MNQTFCGKLCFEKIIPQLNKEQGEYNNMLKESTKAMNKKMKSGGREEEGKGKRK
jgi:hypothetical protein